MSKETPKDGTRNSNDQGSHKQTDKPGKRNPEKEQRNNAKIDREKWHETNTHWSRIDFVAGDQDRETVMGLAQYQILPQGDEWGVLHDGDVRNRYSTKEAAFEAAVAAASLAIREGHEVHISVPDRSSGNQTALGAKNQE
jgi:hypothetical protein